MSRVLFKLSLVLYLLGLYGSGFGQKAAAGVLEWSWGKQETKLVKPAGKVWLALCTVEVKVSDTGASITEAGYTGYVKKEILAANISEASEGATCTIENTKEELFAACTAGSSTVISWALTDKAGLKEGVLIMFGQATSTVISTTQTPPTIAVKALKGELKAT